MIKQMMIAGVAVAAAAFVAPMTVQAAEGKTAMQTQATPAAKKTGYVEVKGVNYYYEIHGTGEPLLLLHGGLGQSTCSGRFCRSLAEEPAGRSPSISTATDARRWETARSTWSTWATTWRVILEKLGYEQVDVLGYSLGGGVAFRLGRAAPGLRAPAGSRLGGVRAGRVLSRDAADASRSRRRHGGR